MKNLIYILGGVLVAIAIVIGVMALSKSVTTKVGDRIDKEIDGLKTEYVLPTENPSNIFYA